MPLPSQADASSLPRQGDAPAVPEKVGKEECEFGVHLPQVASREKKTVGSKAGNGVLAPGHELRQTGAVAGKACTIDRAQTSGEWRQKLS